MNLSKSLVPAVLIGCCIGGGVYRYLLSDWFLVSSIITIYIGVAYFLLSYDITLLGEQFTFDNSYDKLGHTIGVYGLCIGPLAVIDYVDFQPSEAVGVFIWTTGIIAYFTVVSNAQNQQRQ